MIIDYQVLSDQGRSQRFGSEGMLNGNGGGQYLKSQNLRY